TRGDGLDRLSARRDPHDLRARDCRLRTDVSGDDLEALHGARGRPRAFPERVPGCTRLAALDVPPSAVRDEWWVLHVLFGRVRELAGPGHDVADDDRKRVPAGSGTDACADAGSAAPADDADAAAHREP